MKLGSVALVNLLSRIAKYISLSVNFHSSQDGFEFADEDEDNDIFICETLSLTHYHKQAVGIKSREELAFNILETLNIEILTYGEELNNTGYEQIIALLNSTAFKQLTNELEVWFQFDNNTTASTVEYGGEMKYSFNFTGTVQYTTKGIVSFFQSIDSVSLEEFITVV